MARISVIIPCHNGAAYLAEALDSVFAQTEPAFEIIIIDDGSTDDSANVAKRYGDRVRLVSQSHQGISAARNAGLALAAGDFIAFLDADDLWTRDSLAARLAIMEGRPPVDCVFGLVEQFHSPDLAHEESARIRYREGKIPARFAGAMLIRRGVFDRIGGFDIDLRVGETIDFVARLALEGLPTAAADSLVMRRRIHARNTTIQQRASQSDYLHTLKAALDRSALKKRAEQSKS
jgi:glycosyltransferase involved in cell wall biosynthesis